MGVLRISGPQAKIPRAGSPHRGAHLSPPRAPQGDPVAGAVLAYVLVDDRTLAITGPSGRQGLFDALQFTREFDNQCRRSH